MESYLEERVIVSIVDEDLDDDPICLMFKDKITQRSSESLLTELSNLSRKSIRWLTRSYLTSALVKLKSTPDVNLSVRTLTVIPVQQPSGGGNGGNTSDDVQAIPTLDTETTEFVDVLGTLQGPTTSYPVDLVSNQINSEELFYPPDIEVSPNAREVDLESEQNDHGQDSSCKGGTNMTNTVSSYSADTGNLPDTQPEDSIQCNTSINFPVLPTEQGQNNISTVGSFVVPNDNLITGIRHEYLSYREPAELNIFPTDSCDSETPTSTTKTAYTCSQNSVFQDDLSPELCPISLVKNQSHTDEIMPFNSHDDGCPASVENMDHVATKVKKAKSVLKKESNVKPKESLLLKCHLCSTKFHKRPSLFLHIRKIHMATRPVICSVCKMELKTPGSFHQHQLKHLRLRPFSCKSCPKTFVDAHALSTHQTCHVQEKKVDEQKFSAKHLVCNVCNVFFISLEDRIGHSAVHTGETPYVCKKCSKAFSEKNKLKHHEDSHTEETPFVCAICNREFSSKESLMAHKPFHMGKKAFMCGACGRSVSKMKSILTHRRYHTGEKPYSCNLCDKTFRGSANLRVHKKKVHGERSHVCGICCKAFPTRQTLRRHQLYHSGEKAHVCELCGKSFFMKDDLERHIRLHTGDKPFKCTLCERAYVSQKVLNGHVRKKHTRDCVQGPSIRQRRICDICGKTLNTRSGFTYHMKVHTTEKDHLCSVCGKAFHSLVFMHKHEKRHGCKNVRDLW